jgi:hypothetical protein
MLDLPVHLYPLAMVYCGDVVLNAGRLNLHCPIEILWLESSRTTSRIDLSLCSSWFDPHVRFSCVLNRLEVIQLVLMIFSQISTQTSFSYLPQPRTCHSSHPLKRPIACRVTIERVSLDFVSLIGCTTFC